MWARGAEICTLNLLTGLRNMGYEDLYFHAALRQAIPADMELHLKPRFEEVAEVSYGIHGVKPSHLDLNQYLQQAIRNANPDILLYAFDQSIPKYAPIDCKTVLVVHGIAKNDFDGYHPDTDAVVCVSQYAASIASGYGIPEEKIRCIPNGVPAIVGENRRNEWGIPQDAWVWCFVGGLTRLKRPQLLVSALSRRERNDEYVIFAGTQDGGMLLEGYAQALGVGDRCVFLGHTDEVGDVYRSSDCLVITSERESMPLTMLEAMSAGLFIVANDVGGIPEVLGKSSFGKLCDVTIETEFDKALTSVRTPYYQAMRMVSLIVWNDSFSLDIMTARYDNLFTELLGLGVKPNV